LGISQSGNQHAQAEGDYESSYFLNSLLNHFAISFLILQRVAKIPPDPPFTKGGTPCVLRIA
jgi:hypothetical protein